MTNTTATKATRIKSNQVLTFSLDELRDEEEISADEYMYPFFSSKLADEYEDMIEEYKKEVRIHSIMLDEVSIEHCIAMHAYALEHAVRESIGFRRAPWYMLSPLHRMLNYDTFGVQHRLPIFKAEGYGVLAVIRPAFDTGAAADLLTQALAKEGYELVLPYQITDKQKQHFYLKAFNKLCDVCGITDKWFTRAVDKFDVVDTVAEELDILEALKRNREGLIGRD